MSELFQEQIFINDNNISDIFEQKIQVGAVIQFNLLQKIIEEFIKRQKQLTDKVNNLEIKINSGTPRPFSSKMTEDNLMKYFDESNANINNNNLNFEADKEISIKEREDNKENNLKLNEEKEVKEEKKEKEVKEEEKKEEKKEVKEEKKVVEEIKEKPETIEKKEITEKKEKLETKDDKGEATDNKKESNNNLYKILSSRMDKFEKILKELTKKIYSFKENNKDNEENKINNESIKKQDEKINNLEGEINRLNQKVSEMNLLQINFPNDNKENESDDNNKSAEVFKIFSRKIELVENRARQCEEDIFKLKKDNTSINNSLNIIKNNYNEFSKETNKNFSTINQMLNKELSNLKNLMKENDEKIKKEVKDYIDDEIKKVKSMMEEIKSNNMSNSNDSGMNTNLLNSKFNEKLNNLNNDLRNLINKSCSETEKYLKSIINNLPIDNIKKEIGHVYEVLKEKLVKTDLDYLDIKIKEIENRLITETLRLESVEKDMAACNDATTKSVKMIEYLSGQVVQNNQPDMNLEKKDEMLKGLLTVNEKEIKSFVNKNEFTHEIKNIYKKIEQILEVESENYKFTQHIEGRLKFFVTQGDLKTMEQCLMNMIDELKNNFARKYMEKTEILKNFKFLEIQIKTLYDSNPGMIKEGDNWLLAKKPMNNYLCASCEAYLGDLKNNKNVYLPWNKIPPHENKKYRMGNGFSRMLELVNTDLMKNAEKINDNLIIKVDDKKTNSETVNALPRLGSQINLKKWNRNTFYVNNDNNIEKRLNNSADGLEQSNSDSLNKIKSNNLQEMDNIGKNVNNLGEGIYKMTLDKDSKSPKVLKIVKKSKKDI